MSLYQRIKDEKFKSSITRQQELHDCLDTLCFEITRIALPRGPGDLSDEEISSIIHDGIDNAEMGKEYLFELNISDEVRAVPLKHYDLVLDTYTNLLKPLA